MEQPLVSIACITFNQAKYIRQCLDGFVMQKTTFPVEIVIHDDASTDGTQDIIMEYVERYPQFQWKPILQKENQYSKGKGILVPLVYPECTGKYIALCEGDDYWCDEYKLQKQADFLEQNPDYVLCFTNFKRTDNIRHHQGSYPDDQYEKGIMEGPSMIRTLTSMFRNDTLRMIPKAWSDKGWIMGDVPLWIELAHEGKMKYMPEVTSVYRVLENSASHSKNIVKMLAFYDCSYDIRVFYNRQYGNKYNVKKPLQSKMKCAYDAENKQVAGVIMNDCRREHQLDLKTIVFYIGARFPFTKKIFNIYLK